MKDSKVLAFPSDYHEINVLTITLLSLVANFKNENIDLISSITFLFLLSCQTNSTNESTSKVTIKGTRH